MSELARTTGRGFLLIAGAKAWFLVTAAAISLGLPAFFDRHESQGSAEFGIWGVVINMVSIFNMVMITGTLQAVSKVVSEIPSRGGEVVRRSLKVQLVIGVPIAVAYCLCAPLLARALNDETLTPYLRLSSGIILAYSFYAIFVGYFNGRKEFARQATLDMVFATLKVVLVIGAVFLGYGVLAAIGGFVATALTLLILSAAWVYSLVQKDPSRSVDEGHDSDIGRRVLGYMLAIMAYTFALNAIIRADLFLLKSVAAARWGELGLAADRVSDLSNSLSGLYTAMTNIARLPYSGVIAITFVIFPVISQATFKGDHKAAQTYIRQSLRFSFIFVASMAVVVISCRTALLRALYPDEYSAGAEALLWLCLGMIAFALLFVATTILISAGKPIHALLLASGTLVATIALNAILLQAGEVGEPMLARAGIATMTATAAGFIAACVVLHRLFQATVPVATVVRITISAFVIVAVAPIVPIEDLAEGLGGGRLVSMALVGGKMAIFGVLFYVLMYALREFGVEDMARLRSIFRRRSAHSKED